MFLIISEIYLFLFRTHVKYKDEDKFKQTHNWGNILLNTLVKHISTIQNTLQAQAAHAVNLALTSRNWLMGCYIVEFEQNGEDRAAYGEQLLKKLEQRLKTKA
jgi:hypothetical protein